MDALEKAFLDLTSTNIYYFNTETGETLKKNSLSRRGKRLLLVPKLSNDTMISWMEEFTKDLVIFDSPKLEKNLIKALKKNDPIESFLKELKKDETGWIHGWSQWQADHVYEEIENWFYNLPIDIIDDMSELNCDCPLCQMMKEGITDMNEIKKGFQKANAKKMIDEIFEQKNTNN